MREKILKASAALLIFFLLFSPAVAASYKDHINFGIEAAKRKLWKEAYYRFKRAAELNPRSAEAYNNLAVACEALGRFKEAEKYYKKALELDPGNRRIKANYAIFLELVKKKKKRKK